MINTILTNALKLWFWTDETNIINVNKKIDITQQFYAFVYITFTHLDKKEYLNMKDISSLPLKNLNMTINIETFTSEEVRSYFKVVDENGMINLDTEVDRVSEFITKYGYGVCDLICSIYLFYNQRGNVYAQPVFDPENILPHVANMADKISANNPETLVKTNIYLPEKK